MKIKKILYFISIILIVISCLNTNVYATYFKISISTDKEFEFTEEVYTLRGYNDNKRIDMILPEGYTMEDVEIISEDENIVKIFNSITGIFYIESHGIGETTLIAKIEGTNYIAYCTVIVVEPIQFYVIRKDIGATLVIDCTDGLYWSRYRKQAVEILVRPLNSDGEEKWIRLGEGIYGEALNKTYFYDISENCDVTVRYVSWWDSFMFDGEYEYYRKSILLDDINSGVSFRPRIQIFGERNVINQNEYLQLNAQLIEIPTSYEVTWKSYQERVAEVDKNGTVYGVGEGETYIEATVRVVLPSGEDFVYRDVYHIVVNPEISWKYKIFHYYN